MRMKHFISGASRIFLLFFAFAAVSFFSGCGDDEPPQIDCQQVNLTISLASTAVNCPASDGTITATVTNGTGTISFSLDNQNFQESNVFSGLAAGSYTVYAKNEDDCNTSASIVITSSSDISFTSTNMPAGCGGSDGSLTIMASGGSGNYQYALDGGTAQAGNMFTSVGNGNHQVTVIDDQGCETTADAYVRSGISFMDEIAPIIETYCSVSECHAPGEDQPDFTIFSNVQSRAEDIKARTQSGNMPRGTIMPDEFIEAFACWVDDGALDN